MNKKNDYYFQKGGSDNFLPYNWFNPNTVPFKPCQGCNVEMPTCGGQQKQVGGSAESLPYRWFNPNTKPFKPCDSCNVGYDDFSINRDWACAKCSRCGKKIQQVQQAQQIENFSSGAPMGVFVQGEPLKYNYDLKDISGVPMMTKVAPSPFLRKY